MSPEIDAVKPVFGEPPDKKRCLRSDAPNQSLLDIYDETSLIDKALVLGEQVRSAQSQANRQASEEIFQAVWGPDVERSFLFNPSSAAKCLRMVGYEKLGYKPLAKTSEQILALSMGSGVHRTLQAALRPFGETEASMFIGNGEFERGRPDFILKNPRTEKWLVDDFKTTSSWGFRKITRDGLPEWMRATPNIYVPRPEDKLQLLLYMHGLRQKGLEVVIGSVIYINTDNRQRKRCPVIWDELAQVEIDEFMEKVKEARSLISQGQLPPPSVQPKSAKSICGKMCGYRQLCDPGRKELASQVKKETKRKPPWVYRKAKEQAEELKDEMVKQGIVQGPLPGMS